MAIVPDESLLAQVSVSSFELPRSSYPSDWSASLYEDYSRRGQQFASIASQSSRAAEGAYQAQVYAQSNLSMIEDAQRRITSNEKNINSLGRLLSDVRQQVVSLAENPYGSLLRTSPSSVSVPAGGSVQATFNSSISGRGVGIGSVITIESDGVYRVAANALASGLADFTIFVTAGGATYLSRFGTEVDATLPGIDIPLAVGDTISMGYSSSADNTVTQTSLQLSVSRVGL